MERQMETHMFQHVSKTTWMLEVELAGHTQQQPTFSTVRLVTEIPRDELLGLKTSLGS